MHRCVFLPSTGLPNARPNCHAQSANSPLPGGMTFPPQAPGSPASRCVHVGFQHELMAPHICSNRGHATRYGTEPMASAACIIIGWAWRILCRRCPTDLTCSSFLSLTPTPNSPGTAGAYVLPGEPTPQGTNCLPPACELRCELCWCTNPAVPSVVCLMRTDNVHLLRLQQLKWPRNR
jgi:hypothetical protein